MRRSLLEVGDKCEAAVVKYELYKIKTKGKIHALKLVVLHCGCVLQFAITLQSFLLLPSVHRYLSLPPPSFFRSDYQSEVEALRRRVTQLEAEVSLKEDQLRAEDVLRRQLEDDLGKIRAERQDMAGRCVRNALAQA